MILDRTIAPQTKPFQDIKIPILNEQHLANGNSVFIVNSGDQPVVKFELVFEAGNKHEIKTGQAYFTSKMLAEGTKNSSSREIAEKLAVLGYFVEISQGAERTTITLNGLTKHLKKAIEVVSDIISNPIFPSDELSNLQRITKQSLSVSQEKTAYLASVAFKRIVFGEKHYIGKTMTQHDVDQINEGDLIDFFNNHIKNKAFRIFVSGKIDQNLINELDDILGCLVSEKPDLKPHTIMESDYNGKQILIEKEGALQSSIRIGRRMVGRNHMDYFPLKVLNTILGGYFGSRLMKNIREEKGYTYGISSSYLPSPSFGYLLIGTDVKREFTQNTIDEIFKEISILQSEIVKEEEMEIVKNFIIGDFAGSLNTPFDISEKHKLTIVENLPSDFYDNYVKRVNEVTNLQVLEVAQKYISKENVVEIVVGGK